MSTNPTIIHSNNDTAIKRSKKFVVVHFIHTMAYGGIETTIINWLTTIDTNQFEPYLICFANPGQTEQPFIEAATRAGLPVKTIPWSRRKPIFSAAFKLKKMLKAVNADILHTHNTYADIVGAVCAKIHTIKTLTTFYVWANFGWKRLMLQHLNIIAVKGYDGISAHSEQTLKETINRFSNNDIKLIISGFKSNNINYTSEERLQKRREANIADDDIVLVNVARLYPEKAQDFLLHAFKKILAHNPKCKLWILGIGPLEQELRALCTALNLDHAVTFKNFVSELHLLLPLVDIQVHPSHFEGVPISILSGMAAGLPIIATDVGGLPEVLKPNKTGILVPENDMEKFIKEVTHLIFDEQFRKNIGTQAKLFIENEYSIETATLMLQQTYLDLV